MEEMRERGFTPELMYSRAEKFAEYWKRSGHEIRDQCTINLRFFVLG
jgi:hypothetical protein